MAKIKFKETQRYRHWEVIALLAILTLGTAIRLTYTAIVGGQGQLSNLTMGSLLLISLLVAMIYLLKVKMIVKVDKKGIKYSIYPWQNSKRRIHWEEVDQFEIVDLPEQAAMSGWNVQYGSSLRGWNMGNRRGIRIDLRNGEHYFLGVNDLDQLEDTLGELFEEEDD
ncbi:MAG: hypothetical protein R2824_31665 [Saprospiraceae bacterium]|nr:hypothetical protein [Lewinella sp.]